MKEINLEKDTRQVKIVSQIWRLIFLLNNNGIRYSFHYKGYEVILSKYNFDLKEYDEIMWFNITKHSYSFCCDKLAEMLKLLKKDMEEIN